MTRVRRLSLSTLIAALAALLALGLPACGSASQPGDQRRERRRAKAAVALKKIGQFDHPVYVTGAPGFPKLLFVVEQPGRVVGAAATANGSPRPFLDIRGSVGYDGGERGLLSIAFPPDYRQSGSFYVYYNDNAGNIRIDEFKRGSADPRRTRLPAPGDRDPPPGQRQPQRRPDAVPRQPPLLRHRRRRLRRRPAEQRPEQGRAARQAAADRPAARRRRSPTRCPPSNPFVGKPGRDEIYSYGLRNPFRFSFDTVSAAAAADRDRRRRPEPVRGARLHDGRGGERRQLRLGRARGLRPLRRKKTAAPPTRAARPSRSSPTRHSRDGSCSIIGGYVVRDRSLPSLYKRYVYADLCEGQLRSLVPHLKRASGDRKLGLAVASPTSFGEDDAHHLYVASLEGPVFRLVQK